MKCRDCLKVDVKRGAIYCEECRLERNRASTRASKARVKLRPHVPAPPVACKGCGKKLPAKRVWCTDCQDDAKRSYDRDRYERKVGRVVTVTSSMEEQLAAMIAPSVQREEYFADLEILPKSVMRGVITCPRCASRQLSADVVSCARCGEKL